MSPSKRKEIDSPSSSFIETIAQHQHPDLSELPNLVRRCLDQLKAEAEHPRGRLRQKALNVIHRWGELTSIIRDKRVAYQIYDICLQILLTFKTDNKTIVLDFIDCQKELTEMEYEILCFAFPAFKKDLQHGLKNKIHTQTISLLLSCLQNEHLSISSLIKLHMGISSLNIPFIEIRIIEDVKLQLRSGPFWYELIEAYYFYNDNEIRNMCLKMAAQVMAKSDFNEFPFEKQDDEFYLKPDRHIVPAKIHNDPLSPLFLLTEGFYSIKKGNLDIAEKVIHQLFINQQESIALSYLLALYHTVTHDYSRALKHTTDILADDPTNETLHATRLKLAMKLEEHEIMLAESTYFAHLDPEELPIQLLRATSLYKLNRKDEAWQIVESVAKKDPDFIDVYLLRTSFYYWEDRLDLALIEINWVLDHDPDAEAYRLAAKIHLKLNQWQNVIVLCTSALLIDTHDVIARRWRIKAFLKINAYQSTLFDCNILLERNPNDIEVLVNRAIASIGLGHLWRAREDLQHVLELEPDHVEATQLMPMAQEEEDEHPMIAPSA